MAHLVKNLPAMWETWIWSLGWEDPLEKGKSIYSSTLAWRIPMGSQRVGHHWVTFTFTFFHFMCDYWKNHSFDQMNLCWQSNVSAFNTLSRFVVAFLPRSKHVLISWLQSLSTVNLEPKKIKSFTVSIVSPSICHEVIRLDAMIFIFLNVELSTNFFTLLFHFHQQAL